MAVSKRILDLIALALQDRVLTFKERQIIMEAAVKEGTSEAEINAVIDNMLAQRLGSFTKEELGSCPGCGHGVPLLADECPYCGTMLRQQTQRQENPINISDKDAEIIRSENVRVEEEKKKNCPKCGAPYPLVSNICTHCGYVLHERNDSDLNANNLVDNIRESLRRLKASPRPGIFSILKYRSGIFSLYWAVAFLILYRLLQNGTFGLISIVMLIASVLFLLFVRQRTNYYKDVFNDYSILWNLGKETSPLEVADYIFFSSLHSYRKYARLIDTLYGDDAEAKKILADFDAEINEVKKSRSSNRNILTILVIVLLLIPVGIYLYYTFYQK